MKKNIKLISLILFYFFISASLLPEIYVYLFYEKNGSYWCNKYSEQNPNALFNIFKSNDSYLNIYMLDNIKNCQKLNKENIASIVYYKHNLKTGGNPFALIPLPYIYTRDSLEEVNIELSKLLEENPYKHDKDNLVQIESGFYLYWKNKIYQKTGVHIEENLILTDTRGKSFIFCIITFSMIILLHFKYIKNKHNNK